MHNILLLLLHVALLCSATLFAKRLGKSALIAWLCTLAILMNLFVTKQITLFSLHVTASDALAVGYLFTLNVLRENFGVKLARQAIWISFFICTLMLLLSALHLLYEPSVYDVTHQHFQALLLPLPRILIASLVTFLIVQWFDLFLFEKLKQWTSTKRMLILLVLSQSLDSALFSLLALYGTVEHILHIFSLSVLIKSVVALLLAPSTILVQKGEKDVSL